MTLGIYGSKEKKNYLSKLNPDSFLNLSANILKIKGHTNIRIMDGPSDGQRDIHSVDSDGEKCLTQVKFHYKPFHSVSSKEFGEVVIGMIKFRYKKGIFITSGKMSALAKRDALEHFSEKDNYSIEYLEGQDIIDEIFNSIILKSIWYNKNSIDRVSYSLVVPTIARDLISDKPVRIIPRYTFFQYDGLEIQTGRTVVQAHFEISLMNSSVFGEYRLPQIRAAGGWFCMALFTSYLLVFVVPFPRLFRSPRHNDEIP